jgi:pimeloyl-ACP methyl ester carboxylesterase
LNMLTIFIKKRMRNTLLTFTIILLFNNVIAFNGNKNTQDSTVVLSTKTGDIFGTVCLPMSFYKGPVVLIIAGSGPTDRNGNSTFTKNNNLKFIAQNLADSGIASLRFDKRGIGQSAAAMKSERDLIFEDYISDVKQWIIFLQKDTRFTKIIIAGHSEGSLIGMVAATEADKYISISGAGEPIAFTLKKQLKTQPDTIKKLSNTIIDSLSEGHEVKNVPLLLFSLFRPSVQPYLISWFKYNPVAEIAKLKIPVLIIQGDKDLQVSEENAHQLHEACPNSKLVVLQNMNHVLKTVSDEKDNSKSYKDADRPLHPELIREMVSFIKQ